MRKKRENVSAGPIDPAAGERPPLVSVVVPAFQAERTLAETLASASRQTYARIEIIIVDDGSTDRTAAIAASFCEREPRARLVRQPNGGVAAARNRGMAEARGLFVAPLDADDLWHPSKIALQIEAAMAAPQIPGFVYCWSRDIDEAGGVWRDGRRSTHRGSTFLRMLARNFVGNGSALLFHRDAVAAVGGYEEALRAQGREGCEDILFQLRMSGRFPVACAAAFLVGYRSGSDAMSANQEKMFQSWLAARQLLDLDRPLQRRVARQNLAGRHLELAAGLAWRGRWGRALPHALSGLLREPLRAALILPDRLATLRSAPRERPLFMDLDPTTPLAPRRRMTALERLDARRERALARSEAALPASPIQPRSPRAAIAPESAPQGCDGQAGCERPVAHEA